MIAAAVIAVAALGAAPEKRKEQHDQDIPWTAERGEHGIVHFPR